MGKHLNSSLSLFSLIGLLLLFANTQAQKAEQIEIINAEELIGLKRNGKKAQKLVGDVQFKHQNALMYCDSAFMYNNENAIDAYGSIRINQGDTLNLYGDVLLYNGNTQIATVTGKEVRLESKDFTLTTDRLIYNRATNVANYQTGGLIVSKNDSNVLRSVIGYFEADRSLFTFKDSVVLTNPDFVMRSDTLKYFSSTEMVNFLGPTTIEGDSNLIYCETGWYDTPKDQSRYFDNAYLISDGKKLEGDTLYYDRKIGFGKADGNMQITDTAENVTVNGDHGLMYEKKDSAVVFGRPMLTQIFDNDSLFMHADTFKVFQTDTSNRSLLAYYSVKIYKSDLQGKCDSISYSLTDSTIEMHGEPILWSDQNQLTAERVDIRTANNKIHSIFMDVNAFIISEIDSVKYNQIKGKEMTGFFKNGTLSTIKVRGNGQTTYYGQDEKDKFIGVNVAESSDINITLKDKGIHSITFLNKPDATMHPMGELDPVTELRYKGFKWLIDMRPLKKEDIFESGNLKSESGNDNLDEGDSAKSY
jgi:lipopolysaccharide export system protein LptA